MNGITTFRIKNPEEFGKVAVLMGGTSAERAISLKSGAAVLSALQAQNIDAHGVDVDQDIVGALRRGEFDRAFIILHGRGGEDGVIQAVLETLKMPYTGSGVMASALSMDKLRTKLVWLGAGSPTPRFKRYSIQANLNEQIVNIGLPVMIKPAREGSSIGMSKVEKEEHLSAALQKALDFDEEVFAEQWITGNEYTATILDNQPLPLIKLETSHGFYDFEAKYQATDTRYICPCGLDAESEGKLQAVALEAFKIVGCRGWGRVDMMVDRSGAPWLLEVNSVPGMTDHSLVPMAAKAAGLSFQQLVWKILETSFDQDDAVQDTEL